MSVKINAAGWTDVIPEGDARTIHVSTSGSDSYSGASPDTAFRTPSKGIAALREGKGDQCLFKGTDTFPEPIGRVIKSGESKQRPLLIGSYGGGRATFPGGIINWGGGAPPHMQHVVYQSLVFQGHGFGKGVEFLQPISDVLFEDVCVKGFETNMVLQGFGGPLGPDIRMRRCQVLDAWTLGSAHSQGLYVEKLTGLSVFECLFDHNGFNSPTADTGDDIFRHDVYCQNGPASEASTWKNCVFSRGSATGLMLRAGGTVEGCLFTDNPIALIIGGGNTPHPQGVPALAHGNVILNGRDIDAGQPRGWGLAFSNISTGRVEGNVIAHNKGGQPQAAQVDGNFGGGVHGLTLARNIVCDWPGGLQKQGTPQVVENGNDWNRSASLCVDSTRNIPAGYIQMLRGMRKANWDPKMWFPMVRKIAGGYAPK